MLGGLADSSKAGFEFELMRALRISSTALQNISYSSYIRLCLQIVMILAGCLWGADGLSVANSRASFARPSLLYQASYKGNNENKSQLYNANYNNYSEDTIVETALDLNNGIKAYPGTAPRLYPARLDCSIVRSVTAGKYLPQHYREWQLTALIDFGALSNTSYWPMAHLQCPFCVSSHETCTKHYWQSTSVHQRFLVDTYCHYK